MKTTITLGRFAVIATALFFAACSSDDDNGSSSSNIPDGTFIKSTVDGDAWRTYEIQGVSVAAAISNGTGASRLIMINGSGDMNGSTAMAINLIGIDATGEYTFGPDSENITIAYVENQVSFDNSNCDGATGTLKITELSADGIKGTFSLTAKNDENCSQSKTIAGGQFSGEFMN